MTPNVQPVIAETTPVRLGRFRFSVRSLLVLTTLAACPLGWIAKERSQSNFEHQIAKKLEEQGFAIFYLGPYDSWKLDSKRQPQGWWRDLARKVIGERISVIHNLNAPQIEIPGGVRMDTSACDITSIAGLKNLVFLTIHHRYVTDLTPLAGLKNLERMHLKVTSDRDLTPISGLKKLVLQ